MEDLEGWHVTGDGLEGHIVGPGERFRYQVDDGLVKVWIPWEIEFERLRWMVGEGGWAVARGTDRAGYASWGEVFDVEGYYPQWLAPDPERPGHTIFGFAPRDYRTDAPGEVPLAAPPVSVNHPCLGPEGLREFLRWLPYLRQARAG